MTQKPEFIPGLKMGADFHREVVGPIINSCFPGVKYAAALIGPGSEVLGFDDIISTDHDWWPRVFIFLNEDDKERIGSGLADSLREKIPKSFRGFSTEPQDKKDIRSQIVFSVDEFWERVLAFPSSRIPDAKDWLTFPEPILLSLADGAVYKDDTGELTETRNRFSYYPEDIWRYIMAAQWTKISQEEAFMGRCGDAGDEIGSRLVATRLVKELMQLCFQMERRYAPYSKWFGTAFRKLACAGEILPAMMDVLQQTTWKNRQACLDRVYEMVAEKFNGKNITDHRLATAVSNYHTRPYTVINAGRFSEALKKSIKSAVVKNLTPDIGSVSQFVDSTDVLTHPDRCAKLKVIL